jgi:hypothetical protein
MKVTTEGIDTSIQLESGNKLMIGDFDEGTHISILFRGGHSSTPLTRDETWALIDALQLVLEQTKEAA